LRAASQRFSLGVIGFTCGPLVNRIYQLVVCWGGQAAGCVPDWPLAPAGAFLAMGPAGLAPFAAGQGAVAGAAEWVGFCGSGASGSGGWDVSARPAHAEVGGSSNCATSNSRTARPILRGARNLNRPATEFLLAFSALHFKSHALAGERFRCARLSKNRLAV
jgi:hypothetical protein